MKILRYAAIINLLLFMGYFMGCQTKQLTKTVTNSPVSNGITAHYLRCEYKVNPLGIDANVPRLSWLLSSSQPNQKQTAYQILVASSQENLANNNGDLWDSGKVSSDITYCIEYQGKTLTSGTQCFWKVKVWDKIDKPSSWSEPAKWTMGLLNASDWKSQWIGYNTRDTELCQQNIQGPCFYLTDCKWVWYPEGEPAKEAPEAERYFRYHFSLNNAELKKNRRAFIIAVSNDLGFLYVNGKSKRVISEYDIVSLIDIKNDLKAGNNLIAISAKNRKKGPAGLIGKLVIDFSDNTTRSIPIDTFWKAHNKDEKNWFKPAYDDSNWKTVIQTVAYGQAPWANFKLVLPPPTYLRKEFVAAKPIRRAVVYASALGIYELRINGQKVGNDHFTPGWTDYHKRVFYNTYDITNLLHKGGNAVGAIVADGWYSGYISIGWNRDHYGNRTWFRSQIQIEYTDGTTEVIGTDNSWRASLGPLVQSDFLMGEHYDARQELTGWDKVNYKASGWQDVDINDKNDIIIQAYPSVTVQPFQEINPKTIAVPKKGHYVFDMGTNFAGFVRLNIKGSPGQIIQLRFAERLNPDGTIYTENLRGALSTDEYICKGKGQEIWQPRFVFHGFQYVEVTGLNKKPDKSLITGIELTSATPIAGNFSCSDDMANRLYRNICQTQRMNFIDIPTDCPQRDERLGWLGDAQIYIHTACLNNDTQAFFTKWLINLADAQRPNGQFPSVAPFMAVAGDDSGPAWQEAGVICPWTVYQIYGDKRVLEAYYPSMVRFMEFCKNRSTEDLLPPEKYYSCGDWLQIKADTPKDVIYTAYFGLAAKIMAQTAAVLGKTEDANAYQKMFEKIKKSFCKTYVTSDGKIKGDTQCDYTVALAYDMLDESQQKLAIKNLVDDIKRKKWHLSTGFVGTKDLMLVLGRFGRNDVAYRLFHQDTFPSWGFSIRNGATSIWERWDGWTPEKGFQTPTMNSFAHYSFGAVCQWMFENIGGIQQSSVAFKNIIIRPQPGGKLTSAQTSYNSIQGLIATDWKIEHGKFHLKVTIPVNTTATVYVPATDSKYVFENGQPANESSSVKFLRMEPNAAVYRIGSGQYYFVSEKLQKS